MKNISSLTNNQTLNGSTYASTEKRYVYVAQDDSNLVMFTSSNNGTTVYTLDSTT